MLGKQSTPDGRTLRLAFRAVWQALSRRWQLAELRAGLITSSFELASPRTDRSTEGSKQVRRPNCFDLYCRGHGSSHFGVPSPVGQSCSVARNQQQEKGIGYRWLQKVGSDSAKWLSSCCQHKIATSYKLVIDAQGTSLLAQGLFFRLFSCCPRDPVVSSGILRSPAELGFG